MALKMGKVASPSITCLVSESFAYTYAEEWTVIPFFSIEHCFCGNRPDDDMRIVYTKRYQPLSFRQKKSINSKYGISNTLNIGHT